MSDFEVFLQKYALRSSDRIVPAPVDEIFSQLSLKPLSSGTFFRVFRVENEPWVLKEGRWDVEFRLHDTFSLPMLSAITYSLNKHFETEVFPTYEEIGRQFDVYLQVVDYFGFSSDTNTNLKQRKIRDSLVSLIDTIESFYKITLPQSIVSVLESDVRYYDFLPREYSIVGKSISPQNSGKDTSYIFQEFIQGKHLHDVAKAHLNEVQKRQLILLIYIILVMHYEIGLLPDTRPRYPILEMFEWLPKTDNIIVSDGGIKFIDTRWFWETEANFVKRGTLIPELSLNATKLYLNQLLESL